MKDLGTNNSKKIVVSIVESLFLTMKNLINCSNYLIFHNAHANVNYKGDHWNATVHHIPFDENHYCPTPALIIPNNFIVEMDDLVDDVGDLVDDDCGDEGANIKGDPLMDLGKLTWMMVSHRMQRILIGSMTRMTVTIMLLDMLAHWFC